MIAVNNQPVVGLSHEEVGLTSYVRLTHAVVALARHVGLSREELGLTSKEFIYR